MSQTKSRFYIKEKLSPRRNGKHRLFMMLYNEGEKYYLILLKKNYADI
jgi:hypothetical protein